MLSRKAVCLWLLAVSFSIGLAVSAVVLAQQPVSRPAAAEGSGESPEATAGGGGFAGTGVAVGTAESVRASSRSRRASLRRRGSRSSGASSRARAPISNRSFPRSISSSTSAE